MLTFPAGIKSSPQGRGELPWFGAGRALGCPLLGHRDGAVQAESVMGSRKREEDGFVRLEVFKFVAVCLYVTILSVGFFFLSFLSVL